MQQEEIQPSPQEKGAFCAPPEALTTQDLPCQSPQLWNCVPVLKAMDCTVLKVPPLFGSPVNLEAQQQCLQGLPSRVWIFVASSDTLVIIEGTKRRYIARLNGFGGEGPATGICIGSLKARISKDKAKGSKQEKELTSGRLLLPFQGDRTAPWLASLEPVLLFLSIPPASVSSTASAERPARRLRLSACRRVHFSRLFCKTCSGDCASGATTLLGSTTSWRKRRSFFSHTRSKSGQLLATHHSYGEKSS